MDDAIETWQVFEKLQVLAQEQENGETYLEPKPLVYKAKRQTPATARQKERLRDYIKEHQILDEINWETLTRSEASRKLDSYILKYGRKMN